MSKERVRFVLDWERRWKEGEGGQVDGRSLDRGIVPARRRRGETLVLSLE